MFPFLDAGIQTFSESGVSAIFAEILNLLTSAISFLTGNPWLVILVVAPVVFGVLGALLGIFNRGGGG